MSKSPTKIPPEDEVLRRMLNTPPTPHKAKSAPAKKKPQPKKEQQ